MANNMSTIKKLDALSFQSLDLAGIDWRSIIKTHPALTKEYYKFLDLKSKWVYCNQDYSQLEVYVLASLSGDDSLIHAVNAGLDIHSFNTEKVFKLDKKAMEKDLENAKTPDEIKDAQGALDLFKAKRKTIKALTFSLSYGAGKEKIAMDLRISLEEADKLIKDFYNTYPKIKQWQGEMLLGVIKNGYLETKLGRRRAMPKLKGRMDAYSAFIKEDAATIKRLKTDKEYWSLREEFKQVLNTNIQSLSSDMCSLAACKYKEWLKTSGLRAEMYFWVHDSIAFASHIDDAAAAIEGLRQIMENEVKYPGDRVNYRTSLEVGFNYEWAAEIDRNVWIASEDKQQLLVTALDESLDKDIKKKFKLIIKSSSLEMNEDYLKTIKEEKEDYFEYLIKKLDMDGIYTVEDYMSYMNGVSLEEYNESMGFTDDDIEDE